MTWARILLLASAYSPLPMLLAIRVETGWVQVALLLAGLFMLAGLPLVIVIACKVNNPKTFSPSSVHEVTGNVATYLVTFILPFAVISTAEPRDWIAYGALALLLAAVYLQPEQLALNPWLVLAGRRIFATSSHPPDLIITRRYPQDGVTVTTVRLARGLYYDTDRKETHAQHLDTPMDESQLVIPAGSARRRMATRSRLRGPRRTPQSLRGIQPPGSVPSDTRRPSGLAGDGLQPGPRTG